jgi:hypothetical protein
LAARKLLTLTLTCVVAVGSFALGSAGIYFGGKDVLLSELSGGFSVVAYTLPSSARGEEGQRCARLSLRVGYPPPALPQRCAQGASFP